MERLLSRAEDLTKGWLLALLEDAPLEEASSILAGDLARDGPRICEAIIRALADDMDLGRLEPGGALEPLLARTAGLAANAPPQEVSRIVEALHAVIWSAMLDELYHPDADHVSALAARLSLVFGLVRDAALRRAREGEGGSPAAREAERAAEEPRGAEGAPEEPREAERAAEEPRGAERAPEGRPEKPANPGVRALPVEPQPRPMPRLRVASGTPEPEAPRVAQRPHDPLWVGALDDEISSARNSGAPLSLLLVELDDADRVMASEQEAEASATFGRFAQAVRNVVRRQDILACESDARAWIIARDTGRNGAQALGARIADSVRAADPWRGAPLAVCVGASVYGEDGRDSAALIDAAEEAKFAAAASGREFAAGPE